MAWIKEQWARLRAWEMRNPTEDRTATPMHHPRQPTQPPAPGDAAGRQSERG